MSKPNWTNIKKLRDHIAGMKLTKSRKFDMYEWIALISGKYKHGDILSISTVRANGPACGTAGCLAGEAVILFAPKTTMFQVGLNRSSGLGLDICGIDDVYNTARRLLGLDNDEADYMFGGSWTNTTLSDIRGYQAVKYLDKVLAEKDVMVCIGDLARERERAGKCLTGKTSESFVSISQR